MKKYHNNLLQLNICVCKYSVCMYIYIFMHVYVSARGNKVLLSLFTGNTFVNGQILILIITNTYAKLFVFWQ